MPTATVNDRPIFFADTGGEGPVLLLGHGYFLDHSTFSPQAETLTPEWRVITWDARGHGQTPDDDPGTSYTYWDQARDALGLLDQLGIERAVAGGLSQGGFTALRIALLAPERVAGLVLWDTEATACDPADKAGYGEMFAALREYGPIDDLIIPLSTQLLGESSLRDELRARWRAAPALPLGPAAHCLLERDDVSGRLNEITCPTLLMWGEQDVSLPCERMDLLSARLPNASDVHVIRGAAHTPTLTHPEQVNPLLQGFLQSLA
ncbi:alpha/beta fold hydrolase [Amycolatopsis circi]|uniref:alpha/beta fold hydrolase n=1 Tax=Amycolatopsis circi TaxID=871959 RepID=UPI000E287657|nr:alpha/beta hydrolase [Amycolatopsis circi]